VRPSDVARGDGAARMAVDFECRGKGDALIHGAKSSVQPRNATGSQRYGLIPGISNVTQDQPVGRLRSALREGRELRAGGKTPATSHEVRLSNIEAWLQSGGRSPNEQALKVRLRELIGRDRCQL
jgi:hypothetical protein